MTRTVIPGVLPEDFAREGLTAEVQPWEDGLRADTGPGNFEWWYFDAHLDDGSTAVIVYMTKGLLQRNDPLTPALALTITPPDGRKRAVLKPYPAAEFSAREDRCDVCVGPNSAAHLGHAAEGAAWTYAVDAEADGLAAHLTFTGSVPPWRPGAGKTYYSEDRSRYFAWVPAIPFGRVSGSLTYDGQTHAVTGTGYHDHNWGNVGLNAVMSHWYWGRGHVGEYTMIYVEQISTPAYGGVRLPVFLLARGDQILIGDGRPLRLEARNFVRHPSGRSYPTELDWRWEGEQGRVSLTLRNPAIIEATSLLGLLPPWKRRLARLVANPYYFRFNADLTLEVNLDRRETVRGPALYELMLLR